MCLVCPVPNTYVGMQSCIQAMMWWWCVGSANSYPNEVLGSTPQTWLSSLTLSHVSRLTLSGAPKILLYCTEYRRPTTGCCGWLGKCMNPWRNDTAKWMNRFKNIFLEGHLFDTTVAAISIGKAKTQPVVLVNTLVHEGKSPSWILKSRKWINAVCSVLQLHPLLSRPLLHQCRHTAPHIATYSPVIVRIRNLSLPNPPPISSSVVGLLGLYYLDIGWKAPCCNLVLAWYTSSIICIAWSRPPQQAPLPLSSLYGSFASTKY